MKLKNIAVGDFVQVKKSICPTEFEVEEICEVIDIDHTDKHGFDVLIQCNKGMHWVNHKDLKKPIKRRTEPHPKWLDHSMFKQWANCWKFIVIDEDGRAWRYRKKPQIYNDSTSWSSNTTVPVLIGTGYDASNWQNSLIERGTAKHLASSDLCRAMLERGDKYVMCLLSDTSHAGALNSKPRIVTNFVDGMGFIEDSKDQYWYFAVPINNQGGQLSASDVGL